MKNKALLITMALATLALPGRAQNTLAYWNFNSYDPAVDLSSLADAGTQAGSAILDWSDFTSANVRTPAPAGLPQFLPDGVEPGAALGLSASVYRNIGISLSTLGQDYVTVNYALGGQVANGDPGFWEWSTDGVNFLKTGVVQSANQVRFTDSRLANQANVTLRLNQRAIAYSPGLWVNYDNVTATAQDYHSLAVLGEADKRVVLGQKQALNYTIFERTGSPQTYAMSTSDGLSNVMDLANGGNPEKSILANSANLVSGVVDTTGAQAGDTIAATVSVTGSGPDGSTASKTTNVQVLENRTLSLQSGGGDLGYIGRVVQGETVTTLVVGTNERSDSEATRIATTAGTYFRNDVGFVVGVNQVFDSANESASIDVRLFGGLGEQSFSADLSKAQRLINPYHSVAIFTPEVALGSTLENVQPMVVSGSATVLTNRDLVIPVINLGREMVSTGIDNASDTTTVFVSGEPLADNQATRVNLNATDTPITQNGITASIAETTLFNSAHQTAAVEVSYAGAFDRSVAGRQSISADLSGQISNAEDPSVQGVSVDRDLNLTVSKTFVQDRQINVERATVIVGALAGETIGSIFNRITTVGDDDHFTRVTVNDTVLDRATAWADDEVQVNAFSGNSQATTILGTRTVTAVGEGLAGETPDSVSYDYGVAFYQAASAGVAARVSGSDRGTLGRGATGLTLNVGDTITITTAEKDDAGNGERAWTEVYSGFTGNDGFYLNELGNYLAGGLVTTGTLAFDSAGKLNGTHSARLSLVLSNDLSLRGAEFGDLGTYDFTVRTVVTGNSGNGGTAYVASGETLKDAGISTTFSNSVLSQATTAALKDSQTLDGNVQIQIAFQSISDATGTGAGNLVSDTLSLEGLDGVKFVLQMSYDEATLISKFGTEEVAILTWLDTDDDVWKNAIMGNSTYGDTSKENAFGTRFRMSYDDYLAQRVDGLPRLNDFGYDPTQNVMWAVLDHNSDYGGSGYNTVPEPSTWALLGLGAAFVGFLRLRRTAYVA